MRIKLFRRAGRGYVERYFHVFTPEGESYISDTGTCEATLRELLEWYPDATVIPENERGKALAGEQPLFGLLQQENNFVKRPARKLEGDFPIVRAARPGCEPVVIYDPASTTTGQVRPAALASREAAI
jgi:hypothetical protein